MYALILCFGECPLAHFVSLVSTQQTFLVSIKLLGNLAREGLQNQDLRHKALSQALNAGIRNWSCLRTMPTEVFKAYLFFVVDLMEMRGERDRHRENMRVGVNGLRVGIRVMKKAPLSSWRLQFSFKTTSYRGTWVA